MKNKEKFPYKSHINSFYIMKLFSLQKNKNDYEEYINIIMFSNSYIEAIEYLKRKPEKPISLKETSIVKEKNKEKKSKGKRVLYDKNYQTKPEVDETNPLYIFYTTLYIENSDSLLAINWLTKHGIFNAGKRLELENKYKKMKDGS